MITNYFVQCIICELDVILLDVILNYNLLLLSALVIGDLFGFVLLARKYVYWNMVLIVSYV